MYYINYFFLYSIIGYIIETILGYDSGILYGYWTPVYGIGIIIILYTRKVLLKKCENSFTNKCMYCIMYS